MSNWKEEKERHGGINHFSPLIKINKCGKKKNRKEEIMWSQLFGPDDLTKKCGDISLFIYVAFHF